MPEESAMKDELARYGEYLLLLAQSQFPARLRRKLNASDVVQETLLEAHRDVEQFRGNTSGEMAAWLRQILSRNLANVARDWDRQKRDVRREQSFEQSLSESSARLEAWLSDGNLSPSTQAQRNEQLLQLAQVLMSIPEDQRQVIELRYLQGCSIKEISEQLEKSSGAVAGLLHRGLSKLREQLNQG